MKTEAIALMSDAALRETLARIVDASTGIKGVDLVSEVAEACHAEGLRIPTETYEAALRDLVASGRIVEFEYVVPEMPERVKSLFFPAGTEMRLHAA